MKPLAPEERLADAAAVGRGEMGFVEKVPEEEFSIGGAGVDSTLRDWFMS